MINFINDSNSTPYIKLKEKYLKALKEGERSPQALTVSSYNASQKEVNSRYVNLKFIDKEDFIFFSNYNSPKSVEFTSHCQISAILFWKSINIQIRMKARIKRTSTEYNNNYFKNRSIEKNALAISSNQSSEISSFDQVVKNYNNVKINKDLKNCPSYWGGFTFKPYVFEFWEGHDHRLNIRNLYVKTANSWRHSILEP